MASKTVISKDGGKPKEAVGEPGKRRELIERAGSNRFLLEGTA